MKKNYIITTGLFLAAGMVLLSNTAGPGGDLTGSPGSGGACSNCHGGAALGATATILVAEKGTTTQVTSYEAGKTYSIALAITGGTSVKKGVQSTVLNSSDAFTGTMANAQGGATIISANSRSIFQHNAGSTIGAWSYEWTAPASPTGSVTVYLKGVASNSNNSDNGDQVVTATKVLTLSTAQNKEAATVKITAYPNPCVNEIQTSKVLSNANIYDLNGKVVMPMQNDKVNVSQLATGTYLIKGILEGKAVQIRFNKI